MCGTSPPSTSTCVRWSASSPCSSAPAARTTCRCASASRAWPPAAGSSTSPRSSTATSPWPTATPSASSSSSAPTTPCTTWPPWRSTFGPCSAPPSCTAPQTPATTLTPFSSRCCSASSSSPPFRVIPRPRWPRGSPPPSSWPSKTPTRRGPAARGAPHGASPSLPGGAGGRPLPWLPLPDLGQALRPALVQLAHPREPLVRRRRHHPQALRRAGEGPSRAQADPLQGHPHLHQSPAPVPGHLQAAGLLLSVAQRQPHPPPPPPPPPVPDRESAGGGK